MLLGGSYALKLAPQGGIHLNDGDPATPYMPGPDLDANANLRRILGLLAEALDRQDGLDNGLPVNQTDGWALLENRPPGGWKDWNSVRDQALGGSQTKLDALRPCLTLHAWVDLKVIRPTARPDLDGQPYRSWADLRLGRYQQADGSLAPPSRKVPDFERIQGKVVGRAPVSLAWAQTHKPLLIALLTDLGGMYLDETLATDGEGGDFVGRTGSASLTHDWTPSSDVAKLAGYLSAYPTPMATWADWEACCDAVPGGLLSGTSELQTAKRDLLKAHFNPNSRINKFNPNASRWRRIDKSDLLGYSTEFSLLPVHAHEVESVGRILSPEGRVLGSARLAATLPGPSLLRLTTQREFACDQLGNLDLAGDETGVRLPGDLGFISPNKSLTKTWGHRLAGHLSGKGISLQSYPEPCVSMFTGLKMDPADWDGDLQSATLETETNDWYSVNTPIKDMKLLACFTHDFDLAVADAAYAGGNKNVPDTLQANGPTLTYSIYHPEKPNTLYPDGAYSELGRSPAYRSTQNANGVRGVMSFWIKPHYEKHFGAPATARHRAMIRWNSVDQMQCTGSSTDQLFVLFDSQGGMGMGGPVAGAWFETGHSPADADVEMLHRAFVGLDLPRRWRLITFYWDFKSCKVPGGADATGKFIVDAPSGPLAQGHLSMGNTYAQSDNNNYTAASDITINPNPLVGPHLLRLGRAYAAWPQEFSNGAGASMVGEGADATYDELAIYDFGGSTPPLQASNAIFNSPNVLALQRFRDGRYTSSSTYAGLGTAGNTAPEYLSPAIDLGRVILRALAWTQTVPRGLLAPLPPGGQPGVSGDPGVDGRIGFDLTDLSGSAHPPRPSGGAFKSYLMNPTWSRLDLPVATAFRLHAVFQANLQDPSNSPILDPLVLDDVTVVYEPAGGAPPLSWGS